MRLVSTVLTVLISLALGAGATWMVVDSPNGYIGSINSFLLFVAICFVSIVLLIPGLITIKTVGGRCLVLAAVLLPVSFVGFGLAAKQLELGAYHEQPMVRTIPEGLNKVVFKKGITTEQIDEFSTKTLAVERRDGQEYRSAVGVIMALQIDDGHEVLGFGFMDTATVEQCEQVYSRVRSSPIVFKLIEKAPIAD